MKPAQPPLLDVGKPDPGPLKKIVETRWIEKYKAAHLLECGHAYTVTGDKTPKRLRCPACR